MDDVVTGRCLGNSDHKKIEFLILMEARRAINRTAGLNFQDTFRDVDDRVPWETLLKSKQIWKVGHFIPQE